MWKIHFIHWPWVFAELTQADKEVLTDPTWRPLGVHDTHVAFAKWDGGAPNPN